MTVTHPCQPARFAGYRWARPWLVIGSLMASVATVSAAAMPDRLLWFAQAAPTPASERVLRVLSQASADGLEVSDYAVEELRLAIANSVRSGVQEEERVARLDRAISTAVRRYLSDLHGGRLDPRQFGMRYSRSADFDQLIERRLEELAGEAAPDRGASHHGPRALPYSELRQALADYRGLVGNEAFRQALPPLPGGRLRPGQPYGGTALLARRLALFADLPGNTATTTRYEGKLVDGVKSFQARHGLYPDGVLGKDTWLQLEVRPEARVRQIELALERWRWLPHRDVERRIVVNVPEFMLDAYTAAEDGKPALSMRVIVGNARKTRTPLFSGEMRFVEFSPYWNVPPSIAHSETLPRLRRDPGYLTRQGFELVTSEGKVLTTLSEGDLEAIERGRMRIRQRPGASNALGDIKFVFPNPDNIYLHHTATRQLFKRERRDFSHGCIRVEAPVELAKFVLAGEAEWTRERIVQAMRRGKSMTVRLGETLPVIIGYSTAVVRDGRVHFLPDIYGYDAALGEALQRRSAGLRGEAARLRKLGIEFDN